ncbi:MAG TPA: MEDS domain-containing protein [Solirubrobacterales bacterium]|jgi:transcriptional regulator with XRE-family HTH domain|nr:MEDS domain-containing protein [Solirubrobacterales bacterium]
MPQREGYEGPGVASRLRAVRERRGLTREGLAVQSGISWSAIAQLESGRRRHLRPDTAAALTDALGVSIDYLVSGSAAPPAMLEHRALVYATEEEFVDAAAAFLAEGVERSERTLGVASEANLALLRDRLGAVAGEVEFAVSDSWLTTPGSALESVRAFLNRSVANGAPWVRILGEPDWQGRSASEVSQRTAFESRLNLVFAGSPLTVLCSYDARSVDPAVLRQARVTHPVTIEAGVTSASADYADPGGFGLES